MCELNTSPQPIFLASRSEVYEGDLRAAVSKYVDGNEDISLVISLKSY